MRPHHNNLAAFTLIELVMVMMIIAIILAVAAPSLQGFSRGSRLRDAAMQVEAAAREARSQAILTGVTHRLVIDVESRRFRLLRLEGMEFKDARSDVAGIEAISPSYRVTIEKASTEGGDPTALDFFANGRSEPARVRITAEDGDVAVVECATPCEEFRMLRNGGRP